MEKVVHSSSDEPIPFSVIDPDAPIPYRLEEPTEFCQVFVVETPVPTAAE